MELLQWSGWLVALIVGILWWRERGELRKRRRGAMGAIGALRALQKRDYRRALALAEKYLPGEEEFGRDFQHEARGTANASKRAVGNAARPPALRPLGTVEESEVTITANQSASLQSVATAFQHTVLQLEARDHDAQIARRELEDVLASLQDSVLVVDEEARLRFLNAAAQKFFSVRAEDVLGAHVLEALPSFGLEAVIGDALREGRDHAREVSLYGASDEDSGMTNRREVLLRVAPVRRADGNISGAVAIVQDLTELRRLERVRRDFVANASHELRTPIANIRAVAETVLDGAEDPTLVHRFLPRLVEEAERLSRLVSDLLDLARADSNLDAPNARVDLCAIAREATARLHEKSLANRVSIHCKCSAAVWVNGDSAAIEQIAFNLLDNALMYTPAEGEIEIAVCDSDDSLLCSDDDKSENLSAVNSKAATVETGEMWRAPHAQMAVLRVRDSGIGIPNSELPRIFERFYRVDKARSRSQGGTGLGLAIVKHIVERHGGHVRVESEVGRGTTFWISLPAARS